MDVYHDMIVDTENVLKCPMKVVPFSYIYLQINVMQSITLWFYATCYVHKYTLFWDKLFFNTPQNGNISSPIVIIKS